MSGARRPVLRYFLCMGDKHSAAATDELAAAHEVQVLAIPQPRTPAFPGPLRLPALLYRRVFRGPDPDARAALIERTFGHNGWRNGWRDTVYDYDHFHTTAHEVLGCYRGQATLQLGGPDGPRCQLEAGDVLVLPAGTAHRKLDADASFAVVGCYAEGRDYDMQCGDHQDPLQLEQRLRALPLPARDPVYGEAGPLMRYLVQG
jgi:uncharacterized protein YjlB